MNSHRTMITTKCTVFPNNIILCSMYKTEYSRINESTGIWLQTNERTYERMKWNFILCYSLFGCNFFCCSLWFRFKCIKLGIWRLDIILLWLLLNGAIDRNCCRTINKMTLEPLKLKSMARLNSNNMNTAHCTLHTNTHKQIHAYGRNDDCNKKKIKMSITFSFCRFFIVLPDRSIAISEHQVPGTGIWFIHLKWLDFHGSFHRSLYISYFFFFFQMCFVLHLVSVY